MTLHQNESDITQAIKKAKALCACTIRDVEACWASLISKAKIQHTTCIKEAEANCAHALAEAENCCSTAIRESESQGALQAHSIQQSHAKDIQHLEAEAIEEEKKECLTFLITCGTTLRASPPEAHGIKVTPFHLLLGNAPMSTLLSIPPGVSPLQQEPDPQIPPSSAPVAPGLSVQAVTHSPNWGEPPSTSETTSKATPEEPPHSKQKEETLLYKALSRSHQEAFSRDSKLVWQVREDYYQENCPCFDSKTSCNLADVFHNRIESAGLLSSKIYKIKDTWTECSELQYTNCWKGWSSSTLCPP